MLSQENIVDYIYEILLKRKSKGCKDKITIINFHCHENDLYLKHEVKNRVECFCSGVNDEFEVQGPDVVIQTCFLNRAPHKHIEFKIITNK